MARTRQINLYKLIFLAMDHFYDDFLKVQVALVIRGNSAICDSLKYTKPHNSRTLPPLFAIFNSIGDKNQLKMLILNRTVLPRY